MVSEFEGEGAVLGFSDDLTILKLFKSLGNKFLEVFLDDLFGPKVV